MTDNGRVLEYPNLEDCAKCPHCGHEHSDMREWDFGPGLEGHTETDCDSCEKSITVHREVSVYYRTFKVKERQG